MKLTLSSLLFVVAALALWLTLGLGQPIPRGNTDPQQQLISTYRDHAEMVRFDGTGRQQETLTVARAEQYANTNVSRLQNIMATSTSAAEHPWQLQAERGEYHHDTATLELHNNVIVDDLENGGRLVTDKLTVKPDLHLALTEAAVTLTGSDTVTTAVGMRANWDKQHVFLHQDVETHYAR